MTSSRLFLGAFFKKNYSFYRKMLKISEGVEYDAQQADVKFHHWNM